MYRMVVTDLDDTLLRDDKTVSELTINTFIRLKEKGIKVVFATGRSKGNALTLVPYDLFDAMITQNGAVVHIGESVIHAIYIPSVDMMQILRDALSSGVIAAAETTSGVTYSLAQLDDALSWIPDYKIINDDFICNEIERILFRYKRESDLSFLEKCLPESVGYVLGRDGYVQIMHKDATKFKGIVSLCEHYGFSTDEVVAFGDDMNDISMIAGSGRGIAVENALPYVKDFANEVCDTNQKDGMARWLVANILEME